jgi:S-adenosylmethionine decarboxylase
MSATLPDLAPQIHRQRLVIEGTCRTAISKRKVAEYLSLLAQVCDMALLHGPVTHRSKRHGWAGWVHWETSGAHFYAWEKPSVFFSVDIYACKAFDADATVRFTQGFFKAREIAAKEF